MNKLQAGFTKYMKIALKNDSIDYFRSNNKKDVIELVSIDNITEIEVSVSQISDIGTFCFSDLDFSFVTDEKLFLAMNSLTKRQQNIFLLYANGISLVDIAEKLNVSVGTIKATIFQVKEKIKKYMRGV